MNKNWNDPLYVIGRVLDYFDGKDNLNDWPESRPDVNQMIKEQREHDEQLRWSVCDL